MKKINPKIVALVVMLLAGLVAGGKAIDEIVGQPSEAAPNLDDSGAF